MISMVLVNMLLDNPLGWMYQYSRGSGAVQRGIRCCLRYQFAHYTECNQPWVIKQMTCHMIQFNIGRREVQ